MSAKTVAFGPYEVEISESGESVDVLHEGTAFYSRSTQIPSGQVLRDMALEIQRLQRELREAKYEITRLAYRQR